MSRIKEQFSEEINHPQDLKYIDDVYLYWEHQMIHDQMIKDSPISDCCDAPINVTETKDGSIITCTECFCKCNVH